MSHRLFGQAICLCMLLWTLACLPLIAEIPYELEISGVECPETLEVLYSASQALALKNNPPQTLMALKRRAEADIPLFTKVLLSRAYYDARILLDIETECAPAQVHFSIQLGPLYPLKSIAVRLDEKAKDPCNLCNQITAEDLNVVLDDPAYPKTILDAEEALLKYFEDHSYPLAKIIKREVLADQKCHSISVIFHIGCGPLCFFGPTTISGNECIINSFFYKKIVWKEGDIYCPLKIEETIAALDRSGLFSGVTITHADELDEYGRLPMEIHVSESKPRSIGFGIGYSTLRNFGVTAEWEHRNMRNRGEKLSFKSSYWLEHSRAGILSYTVPDFGCPRQDLILTASAQHDETEGYTESYGSFSAILERQFNRCTHFSYGAMYKKLYNSRSDNNGQFDLVKFPFQLWWTNVSDPLDPSFGYSLTLKTSPTCQVRGDNYSYFINQLTLTAYTPVKGFKNLILAGKANFGSIMGAGRYVIPPSERFYAGSENTLRGYSYLTVSPLDCKHNPIGGRSMMIYSLEARLRTSQNLGWVLFWDVGNVYRSTLPSFKHRQLQSLGIGLRYFTPVGPLRLDVGYPLNRRKHVDGPFQAYISIGQSF